LDPALPVRSPSAPDRGAERQVLATDLPTRIKTFNPLLP
jgi:hypothetical protein